MGLFDALKHFAGSVDREYDRRIKTASQVKAYDPTGASHHHAGHAPALGHDTHVERIEGEGGAVGQLQSNAGSHLENDPIAEQIAHR